MATSPKTKKAKGRKPLSDEARRRQMTLGLKPGLLEALEQEVERQSAETSIDLDRSKVTVMVIVTGLAVMNLQRLGKMPPEVMDAIDAERDKLNGGAMD